MIVDWTNEKLELYLVGITSSVLSYKNDNTSKGHVATTIIMSRRILNHDESHNNTINTYNYTDSKFIITMHIEYLLYLFSYDSSTTYPTHNTGSINNSLYKIIQRYHVEEAYHIDVSGSKEEMRCETKDSPGCASTISKKIILLLIYQCHQLTLNLLKTLHLTPFQ